MPNEVTEAHLVRLFESVQGYKGIEHEVMAEKVAAAMRAADTPRVEEVERVARAIDAVQIFSRWNDWTSDHVPGLPIELCRYGGEGEDEIVVLERHPATPDPSNLLPLLVSRERARAALTALRSTDEVK